MTEHDEKEKAAHVCSFCHKTSLEVKALVAGPADLYICIECIEVCAAIMEEKFPVPKEANDVALYAKGFTEGYLAYHNQLAVALNAAGTAQENLELDITYVSLRAAVPTAEAANGV